MEARLLPSPFTTRELALLANMTEGTVRTESTGAEHKYSNQKATDSVTRVARAFRRVSQKSAARAGMIQTTLP